MAKSIGECTTELRAIINELYDIKYSVGKDFDGIGEDFCATCIGKIAIKYEGVLNSLNNIDQTKLSEGY